MYFVDMHHVHIYISIAICRGCLIYLSPMGVDLDCPMEKPYDVSPLAFPMLGWNALSAPDGRTDGGADYLG